MSTDDSADTPPYAPGGRVRPVSGILGGRFAPLRVLGVGGTATALAASDLLAGDQAAVKVLHPELAEDPRVRAAFLREAAVLHRVSHPGLVAFRASGTDQLDGRTLVWIAEDLVPGIPLAVHLQTHGPLPAADALTVAEALLGAVAVLHDAGFVHRDITPRNVLISPPDHGRKLTASDVTLIDLGLVAPAGMTAHGRVAVGPLGHDEHPSATIVGNAPYLSPEHAAGRPVTARSDLYQIGAVLHTALTGRPPTTPFVAADEERLPADAVWEDARPRAQCDRLLAGALAPDPADRYRDAADMLAAITGHTTATRNGSADAITTVHAPTRSRAGEVTTVLPVRDGRPPARPAPASLSMRRRLPEGLPVLRGLVVIAILALLAWGVTNARTIVITAAPTPSPSTPSSATATPALPAVSHPQHTALTVTIPVPTLIGLGYDAAVAALRTAGFNAGAVTQADAATAAGTVLSSDPASGTTVPAGTVIALTVATGMTTVPVLSGLRLEAAITALGQAGLTLDRAAGLDPAASGATDTSLLAGSVPASGARVAVGTPVAVELAAPTPTPAPTAQRTTPGPTSTANP